MHGDARTALERSRCGATSLRGGAASQPPGPWGSFRAASAPGPIWADLPLTPATGSEANLALHRAVVEGTGNRHLARAYQVLRVKIQLLLA